MVNLELVNLEWDGKSGVLRKKKNMKRPRIAAHLSYILNIHKPYQIKHKTLFYFTVILYF